MTVRVYKSTDVGAPVLDGQAGSFVNILDWCLVAGAPTPAGWTTAFTGTNIRSYQTGAGSNNYYIGVDDTTGQTARVRGFETMTAAGVAVASGTNPFPTDAQVSGGLYYYKSNNTGGATSIRPWIVVATERAFYFWSNSRRSLTGFENTIDISFDYGNDATFTEVPFGIMMFFGDIQSYKTGDTHNTMIIANELGTEVCRFQQCVAQGTPPTPLSVTQTGHYLARSQDNAVISLHSSKGSRPDINFHTTLGSLTSTGGSGYDWLGPVFLHKPDGRVWAHSIQVYEPTTVKCTRGRLPGCIDLLSGLCLNYNSATISPSTGALSGRQFMILFLADITLAADPTERIKKSYVLVEISNTW